ncbi:hypothetical protein LTR99_001757 [Exophiala xenobiotica]|uniref:NAD(P)-binding protein n=1 Tax=Vermiconidia calcicola TaxID=1690605 RepID=A0AAV9Q8Q0_9PEZI|nr:hypothetical protein H2202_010632 [Exophiala xenobiotica]KAK5536525.1 hypothetical protein LTR25_005199 [Vermiconidia calcicola]KAK5543334.1 hypothetical protein LTR23_004811 [Chaetothyriales sp. CCFEE 6169]KAK5193101.1 hypothetical protein LTR92_007395 [Exophiala xenobiotica]KAK5212137.1 hypothetical protein LTR41_002379 [Exophiala xenobiotica]
MSSPNKVALITGAGSGIGLYTATQLKKDGWDISIADLNEKTGQAAAEQVGGIFTQVDVTNYASQAKAFAHTWEKYGRIDFVFANAGILDVEDFYAPSETLPPPEPSLLTSKVSCDGAIYTAFLAMHYFRRNPVKGGSLIITSSASALYEAAILPIYCAAKYAVIGLVRSLGKELKKENIRVSAILPGAVPTNIGLPVRLVKLGVKPTLPDDKITKPEHIVGAIKELLDDPNAFAVCMEVSAASRYRREKHEYPDETMAYLMGEKESWTKH